MNTPEQTHDNRGVPLARQILLAVLLIGSSLVSVAWRKAVEPGSLQALLAALLPMPFFALGTWFMVVEIRRCDEMQRRIQLEALAFAFPTSVLFLAFADGVMRAGFWPRFELNDAFLVSVGLYFLGWWWARRRYR